MTGATLEFTVHVWKESSTYIAFALPIEVASCGASPEAARAAVNEAVRGFVESARAHGTLDQILEEAGYRNVEGHWVAPEWIGVEQQSVAV